MGYLVRKVLPFFLLLLVAVSDARAEPFKTSAPVAYLLDVGTGMVLLSKEADRPIEPAAMAKMMTVSVVAGALTSGETSMERDYPVSLDAWRRGGAPSGSATMFAALKSRIRVADLLRGVIVQAANDACLILAEGIAGSEAAFVERSNKLAAVARAVEDPLHERHRFRRPQADDDSPRSGEARPQPHRELSGYLRDLRGEGIHLEQDTPTQSQPAPGAE